VSGHRVTMDDLTAGTRIRHKRWGNTGTVKVDRDIVHVKWKGTFVDDEISEQGPVRPEDVEILETCSCCAELPRAHDSRSPCIKCGHGNL
jgi:hypothetical protein